MAERTLEWSHISPTCPDTLCELVREGCDLFELTLITLSLPLSPPSRLGFRSFEGCYPFSDRDPFILPYTPHVYFIGNQPSFSTRLVTGDDGQQCRIVLLPKFSESGEVVLVNTKSLEVRVQGFEL